LTPVAGASAFVRRVVKDMFTHWGMSDIIFLRTAGLLRDPPTFGRRTVLYLFTPPPLGPLDYTAVPVQAKTIGLILLRLFEVRCPCVFRSPLLSRTSQALCSEAGSSFVFEVMPQPYPPTAPRLFGVVGFPVSVEDVFCAQTEDASFHDESFSLSAWFRKFSALLYGIFPRGSGVLLN